MDKDKQSRVTVQTMFNADEIVSDVQMQILGGAVTSIQQQIIKLQDEGVRKALEELGWKPPGQDMHPAATSKDIDHLFNHYRVKTYLELIAHQAHHIDRLQEKVRNLSGPLGNMGPKFPRG